MRQATWRIGWYSKVILTVITVSLVGLLIRQLPKKVEAKPEYGNVKVAALSLDYRNLLHSLTVYVDYDKKKPLAMLDPRDRELAQTLIENRFPASDSVLQSVLTYKYALGYRVKLISDDFIILESE